MYRLFLLVYTFCLLVVIQHPTQSHEYTASAAGDTVQIVIMSTTDVHGWIMPWDYYTDQPEEQYGLAKAATLIDSIRNIHDYTLLVDAGDWLQGNPLTDYFARVDTLDRHYPFLKAADYLNYDAVVIGNHEFNFGVEYLNYQIDKTQSPILGGSIYYYNTDEPAYTPYIIKDFGNVSVAIIGLTTPGSAVWDRTQVEGRLTFGDGVEAAHRYANEVREFDVNIVVILAHTGLEGESSYFVEDVPDENFGMKIVENVPGIDHLVLGHHHRVIESLTLTGFDGKDVGVIMPGRWASHLGVSEITVTFDSNKNEWIVIEQTTKALPVINVPIHSGVVELIRDEHEEVRQYFTTPIAHTSAHWSAKDARIKSTPIIDLIHHVQMKATGAQLSAAAAFNTQVEFGPGPITRGQIAQLYQYENTLYSIKITGKQVKEYLEYTSQYYLQSDKNEGLKINPDWPGYNFDMIAGVEYEMDVSKPVGQRVVKLLFKGNPVEDDDEFTIAINSYRALGGGRFYMISGAPVINHIDTSVRELIIEYLLEKSEINPQEVYENNWRLGPDL